MPSQIGALKHVILALFYCFSEIMRHYGWFLVMLAAL